MNNFDFDENFSGSVPNLISKKTMQKFDNIFGNNQNTSIYKTTNIENISFYSKYISPNWFCIIAIIFLIMFLVIKYYAKTSQMFTTNNSDELKQTNKYEKSGENINFSNIQLKHEELEYENNQQEIYEQNNPNFELDNYDNYKYGNFVSYNDVYKYPNINDI